MIPYEVSQVYFVQRDLRWVASVAYGLVHYSRLIMP